jgi:type I restriction enzyme S subunit
MKKRLGDYIQEYSVRKKSGEDIPVYSITNSQGFCRDYFSKEVASKDKTTYKIVPRGCFAYNPSRINVGSVDWQRDEERVIVSPLYNVFSVSPEIDQQYLYYYLKSSATLYRIKEVATGSVRDNLRLSMLYDFMIELPSLDIQRQIVSNLDLLASIIRQRNQQLTKLDELIKARFVEMFGDPLNNEKNWNTSTLAEMCDGIGDGLHGTPEYDESGEYPFINGNNLIDGAIRVNALTKRVNKATYEKHYIEISQNAILLSINGTLGKIAFFNGEQVMLGKSACYCNLKVEVNRIFVYNIMKTDAFARYLEDNSTKSTIKNVGLKAIREYRLILPPLSLQKQFAAFVEEVDKSKADVQKALDQTQLLFDSLMQQYFR